MAKKLKTTTRIAAHTIKFGEERKEKIERFRAIRRADGQVISTIDEAVNMLVDKALEVEGITI